MNIVKSIFGGIFKWPKPGMKEIRDVTKGKVLYLPREEPIENIGFKTYNIGLRPWKIFPYYSG